VGRGGEGVEVKVDSAARGVRIDGSARGLVPESEPLPQALELVVGDDAHVSAPVDAAGTAPASLLLIGEAGRYYLVDREANGGTRLGGGVAPKARLVRG